MILQAVCERLVSISKPQVEEIDSLVHFDSPADNLIPLCHFQAGGSEVGMCGGPGRLRGFSVSVRRFDPAVTHPEVRNAG